MTKAIRVSRHQINYITDLWEDETLTLEQIVKIVNQKRLIGDPEITKKWLNVSGRKTLGLGPRDSDMKKKVREEENDFKELPGIHMMKMLGPNAFEDDPIACLPEKPFNKLPPTREYCGASSAFTALSY